MQSPWLDPSIFPPLKKPNENGQAAEEDGKKATGKLFGEESTDVLAKLRALPADEILEKVKQGWPVVTDGWVFPKDPHQIYADGDQHDIPVIVGTNRDEGTMFAPQNAFGGTLDGYLEAMEERYGQFGDEVADFYAPKEKEKLWNVAVQQISDVWFIHPSREFARAMHQQKTPAYVYQFAKPVWGWMGAAHAAEIGYVFGNLEKPKPNDTELSAAFMNYWVQFAKTGNPNSDGNTLWPQYSNSKDQHLVFDKEIKVGSGLRRDACDLYDKILKVKRNPKKVAPLQNK